MMPNAYTHHNWIWTSTIWQVYKLGVRGHLAETGCGVGLYCIAERSGIRFKSLVAKWLGSPAAQHTGKLCVAGLTAYYWVLCSLQGSVTLEVDLWVANATLDPPMQYRGGEKNIERVINLFVGFIAFPLLLYLETVNVWNSNSTFTIYN